LSGKICRTDAMDRREKILLTRVSKYDTVQDQPVSYFDTMPSEGRIGPNG